MIRTQDYLSDEILSTFERSNRFLGTLQRIGLILFHQIQNKHLNKKIILDPGGLQYSSGPDRIWGYSHCDL